MVSWGCPTSGKGHCKMPPQLQGSLYILRRT